MTDRTNRKPRKIPNDFDEHRFVHESLVEICDLLSEMLASTSDATAAKLDQHERLDELNRRVWELRWELDMHQRCSEAPRTGCGSRGLAHAACR